MKCCELTSGKLRETLIFQRLVPVSDGAGGQVVTWTPILTTRGMVAPLSGREAMFAMQREATVTHRIYVRYRADLLPSDRVVVRGVTMQVLSILNLELRNQWLELSCESGVAT